MSGEVHKHIPLRHAQQVENSELYVHCVPAVAPNLASSHVASHFQNRTCRTAATGLLSMTLNFAKLNITRSILHVLYSQTWIKGLYIEVNLYRK